MDDNLSSTEVNSSIKEVEYFVHSITENEADIAYGLHSIGRSYAHHFSSIKLKYKRLAFTWLSALLIGLFFINQNLDFLSDSDISISKLYIDALVTALAICGVKLLSFLDVKVYHPQLGSIFLAQVALEQKYDFLDKEYINMSKLILHKKNFDPVIIDALYYCTMEVIIALLGVFSLYLKFRDCHSFTNIAILISFFVLFLIYEGIYAFKSIYLGVSRRL